MLLPLLLACLPVVPQAESVSLPPGFRLIEVGDGWNQPTDLAFLPDGTPLVIEKAGRLLAWSEEHGHAHTLLDISEEVSNLGARGLDTFALDPDFENNGYVYFMYPVDRHHLFHFGTPGYDPLANDFDGPTITRITRYTMTVPPPSGSSSIVGGCGCGTDCRCGSACVCGVTGGGGAGRGPMVDVHNITIDPASRLVLLGEAKDTGIPAIQVFHDICCLRFGLDGSLLATTGDGGQYLDFGFTPFALQALAEGIIPDYENIGTYRAQAMYSLAGKVLRIDPATGDGLPTNPHFDPLRPRSPESRVWARGFRNPYRFSVMPGTSTGPDDPGMLIVGDVGSTEREELNIVDGPGQNFGWPIYEGLELNSTFAIPYPNLLAPNTLFGLDLKGYGVCGQEYLLFEDLITQESLNPVTLVNPCDQTLALPEVYFPSMHKRPSICWGHLGTAQVGGFDAMGEATVIELGSPESPITGVQFPGSCALAGTYYDAQAYPVEFRDRYYWADYTGGWIRWMTFDPVTKEPDEIGVFGTGIDDPISIELSPTTGEFYVLQFDQGVKRIDYNPNDLPPTAKALRSVRYGPAPTRVRFNSDLSSDPEGQPLRYEWDFDDGTPNSMSASPRHIFPSEDITDQGTVVAAVLELVPPIDTTMPGSVPEVIQDGFFPDPTVGGLEPVFLTVPLGSFDPDPIDWVGYTFAEEHTFHGLVFQEAYEQPIGGYFDILTVQVRQNGTWVQVENLDVQPVYSGLNGSEFEIFRLIFLPIQGDGIRLYGLAGGTARFVGVSELRVLADPEVTGPQRYDVTLTVTDATNQSVSDVVPVWINNTPPTIQVLSPLPGDTYDPDALVVQQLTAVVTDIESPDQAIDVQWRPILHHNDHTHPEPTVFGTSSQATLVPHGVLGLDRYSWEFEVRAIDTDGLETVEVVELFEQPASLTASRYRLPMSEGGTTFFYIDAGSQHAGKLYFLLSSSSGTWPGVTIGNVTIPINLDDFSLLPINPNPFWTNGIGLLDAQGKATVTFELPAFAQVELIGIDLQFAAGVTSQVPLLDFATNPLRFEIVE